MKMYAEQRGRRTRQIIADVLVVAWIGFWAWQGWSTWHSVMDLSDPVERTQSASSGLADNMREAADTLSGIPLLGDAAAVPFDKAAESSQKLADAATRGEEEITVLAWKLGLSLGLVPTVLLGAFYLPPRLRFIRNATAGQAFVDSTHDLDLFAMRALAHQPLHVLGRISEDPAGAWRQGDPAVIRALASLEMRHCGLRPPP